MESAPPVVVDSADVGSQGHWSERRTIEWRIHDFENLPQDNGAHIKGCPILKCHGISWRIRLFPRGRDDDNDGFVAIYIGPANGTFWPEQGLDLKSKIRVMGDTSEHVVQTGTKIRKLRKYEFIGCGDFIERDTLVNNPGYLSNGTMVVQADIQVKRGKPEPWAPRKTIIADMGKMLKSGKCADVSFVVECKSFPAHRNILALRAPTLFELCEDVPPGSDVPIEKVSASIFDALLTFVYTDEPPSPNDLRRDARELLEAADRFGCAGLKLLAESELVKCGVDATNVVSLLLLADARSCALLKEAAMNCVTDDPAAVMASEDWDQVKESKDLLVEIMEAAFGKKGKAKASSGGDDESGYDAMTVTNLRRKLDDAGLSGDGTREMLVKRLKAHHSST